MCEMKGPAERWTESKMAPGFVHGSQFGLSSSSRQKEFCCEERFTCMMAKDTKNKWRPFIISLNYNVESKILCINIPFFINTKDFLCFKHPLDMHVWSVKDLTGSTYLIPCWKETLPGNMIPKSQPSDFFQGFSFFYWYNFQCFSKGSSGA